ncbi:MAG: tetratricopeptide repeat protein [Planctomycetes bacterium]|nr:tetratricopeptide repeat protein [Planctomycetota bacterium]
MSFLLLIVLSLFAQDDPIDEKDKLFRLNYQVFVESNELDEAYKVAHDAKSKYPESLYWTQKIAEVSLWTGRLPEALENYHLIFKQNETAQMRETVLNLAFGVHDYKIAVEILSQDLLKGKLDELDKLIFSYESMGEPEELIKLLQKAYQEQKAEKLLEPISTIQMNIGDVQSAAETFEQMQKRDLLDLESGMRMASALHSLKRFDDGLAILLKIRSKATANDIEYWRTLSDYAWVIGDYNSSIDASYVLYNNKKHSANDIETICAFEKKQNPEKAIKISKEGWEQFKEPYLFLLYTSVATSSNKWEDVYNTIISLSKANLEILKNDPNFYLICGEAAKRLSKLDEARRYFADFIRLSQHSADAYAAFLWFLIDVKDFKSIEIQISELEKNSAVKDDLLLPVAAGCFLLQLHDKAERYLTPVVQSSGQDPFILAFYADLLDALEEKDHANKIRMEIWNNLEQKFNDKEQLASDVPLLSLFVRLSTRFEQPSKVNEILEFARGKLSADELFEIEMASYLARDEHDMVRFLYAKHGQAKSWILLNLALNNDDRTELKRLVINYWKILPTRDRVEALRRTGDSSLAEELAFKGLDDNQRDYLLYRQMRDLYIKSADKFQFEPFITTREDLNYSGRNLSLTKQIENDLFLKAKYGYRSQRSTDKDVLINVPSQDSYGMLAAIFERDDGFLELGIGQRDAIEEFTIAEMLYNTQINNSVNVNLRTEYNAESPESLFLFLGGMKDKYDLSVDFPISNRFLIRSNIEYNSFKTQDNERLGNGKIFTLENSQRWRSGYPDLVTRVYGMYGTFSDNNKKGVISELTPFTAFDIVPDSFKEIGAGFVVGVENRDSYVRVWRPFIDGNASYNTTFGAGYSVGTGIGGLLFGQDNCALGVNYSVGQNNLDEPIMTLYIRYNLWF